MRYIAIFAGVTATLALTVNAPAGTVDMTSYAADGPVGPYFGSSNAYSTYLDNTMQALKNDSSSVGSGRAKYERVGSVTPPSAMFTDKFGAFGDTVQVSGESGKALYWGLTVTTDSSTQVAVEDLSATTTATNDAFGIDGQNEFAFDFDNVTYSEGFVGIKDDGTILNSGEDGSTLVSEIRTAGVSLSFKLEDELPGASGTEKEQWVALWEEINTTLDDNDGSVELTTVYEMAPPSPGEFPSTSTSVTLNSSPPDVNSVPTPSSLLSGLVLFGVLGGSRWLRRPHRDRR